jgi:hypothetical protein
MKLKNGQVFTSKFIGTASSSYEKRIYRIAVSQSLRNYKKRIYRIAVWQKLRNYKKYLPDRGLTKVEKL